GMSVKICVRQLVVDGSQSVSAARADGANVRSVSAAGSERRAMPNMSVRTASVVPQPLSRLEWKTFADAGRSAVVRSEIAVGFCPSARQFLLGRGAAAPMRGCFEIVRAGQYYIAEKQHESRCSQHEAAGSRVAPEPVH